MLQPDYFIAGEFQAFDLPPTSFTNGLGFLVASELAATDNPGAPAAGSTFHNGYSFDPDGKLNVKVDQSVAGAVFHNGLLFDPAGALHVTNNAGAATFRTGRFLSDADGRVLFSVLT